MTLTDTDLGFDCEIDGVEDSAAFRLLELLWEACHEKFAEDADGEPVLN